MTEPLGVTCLVPPTVTVWIARNQQIYAGETLCGLLVPWVHSGILSGRDAVWFVDNEAAVASLIKAGCLAWALRTNGPKPSHGPYVKSFFQKGNSSLWLDPRISSLSSPY